MTVYEAMYMTDDVSHGDVVTVSDVKTRPFTTMKEAEDWIEAAYSKVRGREDVAFYRDVRVWNVG